VGFWDWLPWSSRPQQDRKSRSKSASDSGSTPKTSSVRLGPYPTPAEVDVPGSWPREVTGSHRRAKVVRQRLGPLTAILQFTRTPLSPWAIGVYVDGVQVGWLPGGGDELDPEVEWLKQLEEEYVIPRVAGECEKRGSSKVIVVFMPSDHGLPEAARAMIADRRRRHPLNVDD